MICSSTAIYCNQCGDKLPEPVFNETAAMLLLKEGIDIGVTISGRNIHFDPLSNHPDKVLYKRVSDFLELITDSVGFCKVFNRLDDLITCKGLGQQLDKTIVKRLERFNEDTPDPEKDQELYQRIHDFLELLDDSL
jgi:hypothetical protein